MFSPIFVRAASAAALCMAAALDAAAAPLTLAQAQQLAVQRSQLIGAQDHALTAAREQAVAAGQLPDPVLKAGVDNLPVNGSERLRIGDDFMTMRRIGISQELVRADKRQSRAQRFEREADIARASRRLAQASVQRDTAQAWLALYYQRQMAVLAERLVAQARDEILAAEAAYRGGRIARSEVLSAQASLLALEDRASEAQRRVQTAQIGLARWTGVAEAPELGEPPAIGKLPLDLAHLDTQLGHHPQVALLARQTELAQADARQAEADLHPDWTVELSYQQRGNGYSNMVSFGVSVPLQWDRPQRQDRQLAARRAQVEQAQAEQDEALRTHLAETRGMAAEWQNGLARLARYEQSIQPLAAERSAAALAAWRGGKGALADVLAAWRGELETQQQYLQLQLDTSRLWAELNYLQAETAGEP